MNTNFSCAKQQHKYWEGSITQINEVSLREF